LPPQGYLIVLFSTNIFFAASENLGVFCPAREEAVMKQGVIAVMVLSLMGVALQAAARPAKRFDETTQTCRIIGDGPLEWESSAWGQGGKMFKSLCQSCHSRNNDKGAPFLWVESKTSNGWNRVFTQKYPQCAKDGSWQAMTMEEQLMVNDYLYRWAKNSADLNDNC
jgi:hypothetical protein